MALSFVYIIVMIFLFLVGIGWGIGFFDKLFDKIIFSLLYGCHCAGLLICLLKL